jgi:ankyrin repeat protein/tetratricopeptide (TPR) repeat protein
MAMPCVLERWIRWSVRPALAIFVLAGSTLLLAPLRAATATPAPPPVPDSPEARLEKALVAEESRRDLEAAIAAYEQVVRAIDDQRRLAATAVFRLGECYRKTGRTNDAVLQYQRLLRDFSAEEILARLSRQNLAALGAPVPQPLPTPPAVAALPPAYPAVPPGARPAATSAGRAEQVALLEQEIALLEKQLSSTRIRFQSGAADQNAIWLIEREILQLRRQLVALRDTPVRSDILELPLVQPGPPASDAAATAAPDSPANPDLDLLVARIAEFEQRSPKETGALAAFQEVFPDSELATLQKKIKDAESKLSSLQSNTDENASEISSTESELGQLRNRRQVRWDAVLAEQRQRAQTLGRTTPSPTGPVSAADAAEIARLRALIVQSPDLLDAPTGDPALAPIHRASANGQLAVVRFLLDQGADVNNARSPQNWTPLHHAAAKGHKAIVELLLARGANPDALARDDSTPLHQAVNRDYREVVRVLLAGGAQVDARGWSGGNWRQIARGNVISQERDSAFTPLHLAAQQGSTNLIALLLAAGADVDAVNSWQSTPLHLAVEARKTAAAAQLLAAKADPNRFDASGQTPLHVALGTAGQAIRPGPPSTTPPAQPDLVRLLLDGGADPNLPHNSGATPLLLILNRWRGAARPGDWRPDTNLVVALLAAGADVNRPGTGSAADQLPIGETVANNDLATTRLLLDSQANPNLAVGDEADTPLHRAVGRRNKPMVELLLARGADPNLRNRAGQTPEDLVNPKPVATAPAGVQTPGIPGIPVPTSPGQPQRLPRSRPGNFSVEFPTLPPFPGAPPTPDPTSPAPASEVELAELFRARPAPTTAPSTNTPTPPR